MDRECLEKTEEMICLLFSYTVAAHIIKDFRGRWVGLEYVGRFSTNTETEFAQISIELDPNKNKLEDRWVTANVSLVSGQHSTFPANPIQCHGFYYPGRRYIFLISILKSNYFGKERYIDLIQNAIDDQTPTNHSVLHQSIFKYLKKREKRFIPKNLFTFLFKYVENSTIKVSLYPGLEFETKLNGTCLCYAGQIQITANEFIRKEFVSKSKTYAVFDSIFLILSFMNWENFLDIRTDLYSIMAVFMLTGFDISHLMLLRFIGLSCIDNFRVYRFITFFMIGMLFKHNAWTILKINRNLNRMIYPYFYIISIYSIVLLIFIDNYPTISLLFMFSFWVPQISLAAFNDNRKTLPQKFVIPQTLTRLLPYMYLFHQQNVLGINGKKSTYIALLWAIIQIVIMHLQNKYGGSFFIPWRERVQEFDYYASQPAVGEECSICMDEIHENELSVTTPCHHAFHDRCLRRWLQEQLICPNCRAELPPMAEEEDVIGI